MSMERSAVVSECGRWRYRLGRRWAAGAPALFVMLNPSTADADVDDPTIRRCIGFARSWGFPALDVVNLFGWRATNPKELRDLATSDARGPDNERHVCEAMSGAALVVAAWGASIAQGPRLFAVASPQPTPVPHIAGSMLVDVQCLGVTKWGHPKHPLYVPASTVPQPWP